MDVTDASSSSQSLAERVLCDGTRDTGLVRGLLLQCGTACAARDKTADVDFNNGGNGMTAQDYTPKATFVLQAGFRDPRWLAIGGVASECALTVIRPGVKGSLPTLCRRATWAPSWAERPHAT
jgi:hypothetical protein